MTHIICTFYVYTVNCTRLHILYIHFMYILTIAVDDTHYI